MYFDIKKIVAEATSIKDNAPSVFKFDANRDRMPYQPNEAIIIGDAFRDGYLPGRVAASELNYNHIQNPADIVGRPRDEFEALQIQRNLLSAEDSPVDDTTIDTSVENSPAPESSQE